MLNLATVGTSAITDFFLAACRLTGKYKFCVAYSRNNEKAKTFAEKNGFEDFCTDINELAKSNAIDTVYIASPNSLHYKQSKLFLENGKNVICEKPIVTNLSEYCELLDISENNGLIYAEAIMSRYSVGRAPLHSALKEIGNIAQIRLDFGQRSSRYDRFMSGEHMNIFDMSLSAGTLTDLGIYCVWAAVDLFGMPKKILASSSIIRDGVDGSGTAIFVYDDFSAVLTYSKVANSAIFSEITGDAGVIKIGSVSQYTNISLVKDGKDTPLFGQLEKPEIMQGEAEKIANFILYKDIFRNDYLEICQQTKNVHKCMDIIKQAANLKYPIKE